MPRKSCAILEIPDGDACLASCEIMVSYTLVIALRVSYETKAVCLKESFLIYIEDSVIDSLIKTHCHLLILEIKSLLLIIGCKICVVCCYIRSSSKGLS
jgi:hypothetical protein